MENIKSHPDVHFNLDSSEWKTWKIGDLVTEKNRSVVLEDDEEYQLVTVKRRNEGVVSRGYLKGKDILVKNYFEVQEGDYIISKRQIVHGANGLVPKSLDKAVVSNEYLVLTSNENITTEYWALISKLPEMYKKFFVSSYGVDIEKLVFDVEDWKKREIIIPEVREQKEITKFFHDLGKLLSSHSEKYVKLKNFKKAMLEKMFPKEDSIVPEMRFKGFHEPWSLVPFKELATLKRGLTYSPNDVAKEGVRVLRSSNIDEDYFIQKENDVFVREEAINIEHIKEGEILITSANGSSKLVGKHAVVNHLNEKTVHGGFMLLAKAKNSLFLNASMSSSWYTKFINLYTAGGGGSIGNLSKSDLEEYEILTPLEGEQKKIGNYFNNLDNLIRHHKHQILSLKNLKTACFEKMTNAISKENI